MKPKTIIWSIVVVILFIVFSIAGWKRVVANREGAEYQEQLKLARDDGIPTTAAEFTATIASAKPEENAAPLYRELHFKLKSLGDFLAADTKLLSNPTPKNLEIAKKLIQDAKSCFEILDKATSRPKCWFNRDWSLGAAVLLPEYADLKSSARLLALRGTVAADEGRVEDAVNTAAEIVRLSQHAGEEGFAISALVSEAIYLNDLREIASWCVLHPNVPAYRETLAAAVKAEPKPNLMRENRDRLFMLMTTIDESQSPAGLKKLGLKPNEINSGPSLASMFMSPMQARIAIVKADRAFWAALKLPQDQMTNAISKAEERQDTALEAFPVAARMMSMLSGEDRTEYRMADWQAHQVAYAGVLRALISGGIAKTIKTSDLLSPFDKVPLKYSFDGKQMTIMIDRYVDAGVLNLRIPPSPPSSSPASPPRI